MKSGDLVLSISRRRWFVPGLTMALLAVYVGSYAILSIKGGWVVSESGELRIGSAVADIIQWQPLYGECQLFHRIDDSYRLRGDALGHIYAPLIIFDQHFIHRTIRFINADGTGPDPIPAPPRAEYHPIKEHRFLHRFPYR